MAANNESRRGVLSRDPSVMRHNIEQLYHAWEAAPSNKKADLLLRGPSLGWAESLMLSNAGELDRGLKQYIQRSLARSVAQSAAGRAVAETEELSKESRTYWAVIAMAAFTVTTLLPPLVRDAIDRVSATKPAAQIAKPAAGAAPVMDEKPPVDEQREVRVTTVTVGPNGAVVDNESRATGVSANTPGMSFNRKPQPAGTAPATPVTQASVEVPLPPRAKKSKSELELAAEQMQHLSQLHETALDRGVPAVAAQIALEAAYFHKSRSSLESASELERIATTMLYRSFGTRTPLLEIGEAAEPGGQLEFCKIADRAVAPLAEGRLVVLDTASRRRIGAFAPEPDFGRQAAVDRSCSKAAFVTEDYIVRLVSLLETKPVVRLFGHDADIISMEFSADGQKAITASFDATARVWDTKSGRTTATLRGHEDRVLGAKLSPDMRIAVTWSDDRTVRVWDAVAGRQLWRLDGHSSPVIGATYSPDSTRVITMAFDGQVRVWSTSTGKLETRLEPPAGSVTSMEFSRDGQRIATIEHDGTVGVWNAVSMSRIAELKGAGVEFRQVAFSPDTQTLATVAWNGRVALWHAETGRKLAELSKAADNAIDVRFSSDGVRLEAITQTGAMLSWLAFASPQRAAEHAMANAGPCLNEEQRAALQLTSGPLPWCRTVDAQLERPEPSPGSGQDP